jgi:hypothetical protein
MRVLEHHQDGAGPRHRLELMQQRLEQHLPLALRAEIECGRGVRQRQHLGHERDFVPIAGAGSELRFELVELILDGVFAVETGGAFELGDERIERAVLVVRRAEIAQACQILAFEPVAQGGGET